MSQRHLDLSIQLRLNGSHGPLAQVQRQLKRAADEGELRWAPAASEALNCTLLTVRQMPAEAAEILKVALARACRNQRPLSLEITGWRIDDAGRCEASVSALDDDAGADLAALLRGLSAQLELYGFDTTGSPARPLIHIGELSGQVPGGLPQGDGPLGIFSADEVIVLELTSSDHGDTTRQIGALHLTQVAPDVPTEPADLRAQISAALDRRLKRYEMLSKQAMRRRRPRPGADRRRLQDEREEDAPQEAASDLQVASGEDSSTNRESARRPRRRRRRAPRKK